MAIKISKKIKSYSVVKPEDKAAESAQSPAPAGAASAAIAFPGADIIHMAGRLGLTRRLDPEDIEVDLRGVFRQADWVKATWCKIVTRCWEE